VKVTRQIIMRLGEVLGWSLLPGSNLVVVISIFDCNCIIWVPCFSTVFAEDETDDLN